MVMVRKYARVSPSLAFFQGLKSLGINSRKTGVFAGDNFFFWNYEKETGIQTLYINNHFIERILHALLFGSFLFTQWRDKERRRPLQTPLFPRETCFSKEIRGGKTNFWGAAWWVPLKDISSALFMMIFLKGPSFIEAVFHAERGTALVFLMIASPLIICAGQLRRDLITRLSRIQTPTGMTRIG